MSQVDWSKAPEGATHYTPGREGEGTNPVYWRVVEGAVVNAWAVFKSGDLKEISINRLLDLDRSDLVERPSPAWSGEGLPPVGVRCEAAIPHTSGLDNARSFIWIEGSVVAYHKIKGKTYAWFAEDDGFYPPNVLEFRPMRTPEQIAADEREADISELTKFFMNYYGDPKGAEKYFLVSRSPHDAGYRKQDQPK